MINIVGYDSFRSKKNGNVYYLVYFTWPDDIDYGLKAAQAITSEEKFLQFKADPSKVKVGYNKDNAKYFLFLK